MPKHQTYATHVHRPVLASVAAVFATAAFALFLVEAMRAPGRMAIASLALSGGVLALVAISRIYIVKLQDRIIRLEMRVRFARLGLEPIYDSLSTPQLVALRFAADGELAALADRVLRENLTSKQIKQAVRDWQPDYHRT